MTKAVGITPEGIVFETEVNLKGMQEIVGGYIAPAQVHPAIGEGELYVNDEGLLMNLPENIIAMMLTGQFLVGNAVVVGPVDDKGRTTDVTEDMIDALVDILNLSPLR